MNDKPLVISYLRWSSGQQRAGDSERRQLDEVTEYLDSNGYTISEDHVLRDDGKSGFHQENFSETGALGQFITQVKEGKIPKGTILIIEDFSRFSRAKVRLAQEKFLQLINNGIRIYIAKDKKEYSEENCETVDLIVSLAKMTSAHEESERKSNHLVKYWAEKRRKAFESSSKNKYPVLLPSTPPSWIRKVKKDGEYFYEPIEERVKVIKYIFYLADCGGNDGLGMGSGLIVRQLEKEGIKPFEHYKRNKAISFNDSYIVRLLKDDRLLGYLQPFINPVNPTTGKRERKPSGTKIPNYFPPVIDKETFNRVRDKIEQRKRYTVGKVSKKFSNLFTNIVKCTYCGNSMTMFTKRGSKAEGKRSVYLQCSEGTKHKKCGNRAVRYYDTFERTIISSLTEMNLSHLFETSNQTNNLELRNLKEQAAKLEIALEKLNKTIVNASKICMENPDDTFFEQARQELMEEQKIIIGKLDSLKAQIFNNRENTSYVNFKENLDYVLATQISHDDIETYNKRRSINTYLKDLLQYIAVDGVARKAWVVFKKEHILKKIAKAVNDGNKWLQTQMAEGKASLTLNSSSNEHFETFGFFPLHVEVFLHRFTELNNVNVNDLRISHEVAPQELIAINKILNKAINKGWQKNKNINYEVLDNTQHNELYSQFEPHYSEDYIEELVALSELQDKGIK